MLPGLRLELERDYATQLAERLEEALSEDAVQENSPASETIHNHRAKFEEHVSLFCHELAKEERERWGYGGAEVLGALISECVAGQVEMPLTQRSNNWHGPDNDQKRRWHGRALEGAETGDSARREARWRKESRGRFLRRCQGRSLPPSIRKFIISESLFSVAHMDQCKSDILKGVPDRSNNGAVPGSPSSVTSGTDDRGENDIALGAAAVAIGVTKPLNDETGGADANGNNSSISSGSGGASDGLPRLSKIHNLISRAVRATFRRLKSVWSLQEEHIRRANTILNQYFIMTGYFHSSLVPLLATLLCEFLEEPGFSDLAFVSMLDQLHRALPGRSEAAQVAKNIWSRLNQEAPNVTLSIRNLIEKHRIQAARVAEATSMAATAATAAGQSPVAAAAAAQAHACDETSSPQGIGAAEEVDPDELEPYMLVSPLVECCLVGVLRREAVLFVWTECLIEAAIGATISDSADDPTQVRDNSVWSSERFVRICTAALLLIKENLGGLQSISELQRVLKEKPVDIHTCDLRKACIT